LRKEEIPARESGVAGQISENYKTVWNVPA
jgi:hypothetical protein